MGRRIVSVKKPGQPGTKKYLDQFGEKLRAVRYIYDEDAASKQITIELVQDVQYWSPELSRLRPDDFVGVPIRKDEVELRAKVKKAGAYWDPYDKLWFVRYKELGPLGLRQRPLTIKEEPAHYAT